MSKFSITVREDKDYHFKIAIKAKDPSALITGKAPDLILESNQWQLNDLQGLTSVRVAKFHLPDSQSNKIADLSRRLFPKQEDLIWGAGIHTQPTYPGFFAGCTYSNYDPAILTLEDLCNIFEDMLNSGKVDADARIGVRKITGQIFNTINVSKTLTVKHVIDLKTDPSLSRHLDGLIKVELIHIFSGNSYYGFRYGASKRNPFDYFINDIAIYPKKQIILDITKRVMFTSGQTSRTLVTPKPKP